MQDTSVQKEPVRMAPVPVLPPPPVTPPAAAKKPLFQTADTTSNFDDAPEPAECTETTDFFPEQVALTVGSKQPPPQQQQSLPIQTSLQPFGLTPTPTAPEALPTPAEAEPGPSAAPAPMFLPTSSSRQLQPLPPAQQQRILETQQSQQQPRELQQQRSARLPPLQTQPQPLTESGPGPALTSALTGPAADDPWSSLQSTYRIRESQAAAKADSTRSRVMGGSGRDVGKEVLVLGDDDDDFGGAAAAGLNSTSNSALNRSSGYGARQPISLPPPQFGSGPKKGGWGSGAMAQAGELMLGEDDWLVNDRPPGGSAGGLALPPPGPSAARQTSPSQQQAAAVMAYNSRAKLVAEQEDRHAPVALKGPARPSKDKATDDVLCEDVEDVDTLLEDEMEVSDRAPARTLSTDSDRD